MGGDNELRTLPCKVVNIGHQSQHTHWRNGSFRFVQNKKVRLMVCNIL